MMATRQSLELLLGDVPRRRPVADLGGDARREIVGLEERDGAERARLRRTG
jgi:hypothetical protein